VGGLLCERRIGADAPAPPSLQRDLVLPQHPPDLVLGDIAQMLAQQGAVPTRITGRRRRIQSPEEPPLILGVVVPPLVGARGISHLRRGGSPCSPGGGPPTTSQSLAEQCGHATC